MHVTIKSASIQGIDAQQVNVEVSTMGSFPSFDTVGLTTEQSVRESRVRIRSAMREARIDFPKQRIIANLTPIEIRKEGPSFDLPIALAIASLGHVIQAGELAGWLVIGELSLSGELRPVRGAIAVAELARKLGLKGVICPSSNAREASLPGVKVRHAKTLGELVERLQSGEWEPVVILSDSNSYGRMPCWSDVRGQDKAKHALEVAVAGGFRVLLNGPPGCGKTMLARRLPTILPDLDLQESIEVTKVHSVAGLLPRGVRLLKQRPFRAPHHTGSIVSLVGGGFMPRPGELSLAHNGVLYLDELPEFPRSSIESIAIPLDDGYVSVCRNRSAAIFPAKTMLVAAANPCPCGFSGSGHGCSCSDGAKKRYSKRRTDFAKALGIDLTIEIEAQSPRDLKDQAAGETSEVVRRRVTRSQKMQRERYGCLISGTDTPLAEAVAVVLATLDGRATVKNSDLVYGSMLFGLTDNQDALEGRQ